MLFTSRLEGAGGKRLKVSEFAKKVGVLETGVGNDRGAVGELAEKGA